MFYTYGAPRRILSDQGREFINYIYCCNFRTKLLCRLPPLQQPPTALKTAGLPVGTKRPCDSNNEMEPEQKQQCQELLLSSRSIEKTSSASRFRYVCPVVSHCHSVDVCWLQNCSSSLWYSGSMAWTSSMDRHLDIPSVFSGTCPC